MQCVHNHSEKEIMFYGCETNPMNQPIDEKCCEKCWDLSLSDDTRTCFVTDCPCHRPINEKWKIDFRKEFPSFLTDNHNGKIVPIYNGWWVFVQGYKRRNLPQDIEDFIENLLEQERAERDNFWAKNEESRLKNYEALGYHKGKMAERKRMSEVLTVNLDMSQMLDGWDKYWIDAKNGRYIEGCAECGNSKRIKESIINK